jgi:microcystin-dependent protein
MAESFIGEIRMFAGTFAPLGWAFCSGQLIAISENDTLYTLIGTTYGGDGVTTFALPNLQGRLPVHMGQGPGLTPIVIGQLGGAESVTLSPQQLPGHTHSFQASTAAGTSATPQGQVVAASATVELYRESTPGTALAGAAVSPVGQSLPHDNVQPFLCVNFIISLYGTFPTQS